MKAGFDPGRLKSTHVITATIAGLGLGLLANLAIPVFSAQVDLAYRIGLAFWYATLGGCAGLLHHHWQDSFCGAHHPSFDWLTAGLLCAWCNTLLVLLAFESAIPVTALALNATMPKAWLIVEGALAGPTITWTSKQLSDYTGIR